MGGRTFVICERYPLCLFLEQRSLRAQPRVRRIMLYLATLGAAIGLIFIITAGQMSSPPLDARGLANDVADVFPPLSHPYRAATDLSAATHNVVQSGSFVGGSAPDTQSARGRTLLALGRRTRVFAATTPVSVCAPAAACSFHVEPTELPQDHAGWPTAAGKRVEQRIVLRFVNGVLSEGVHVGANKITKSANGHVLEVRLRVDSTTEMLALEAVDDAGGGMAVSHFYPAYYMVADLGSPKPDGLVGIAMRDTATRFSRPTYDDTGAVGIMVQLSAAAGANHFLHVELVDTTAGNALTVARSNSFLIAAPGLLLLDSLVGHQLSSVSVGSSCPWCVMSFLDRHPPRLPAHVVFPYGVIRSSAALLARLQHIAQVRIQPDSVRLLRSLVLDRYVAIETDTSLDALRPQSMMPQFVQRTAWATASTTRAPYAAGQLDHDWSDGEQLMVLRWKEEILQFRRGTFAFASRGSVGPYSVQFIVDSLSSGTARVLACGGRSLRLLSIAGGRSIETQARCGWMVELPEGARVVVIDARLRIAAFTLRQRDTEYLLLTSREAAWPLDIPQSAIRR